MAVRVKVELDLSMQEAGNLMRQVLKYLDTDKIDEDDQKEFRLDFFNSLISQPIDDKVILDISQSTSKLNEAIQNASKSYPSLREIAPILNHIHPHFAEFLVFIKSSQLLSFPNEHVLRYIGKVSSAFRSWMELSKTFIEDDNPEYAYFKSAYHSIGINSESFEGLDFDKIERHQFDVFVFSWFALRNLYRSRSSYRGDLDYICVVIHEIYFNVGLLIPQQRKGRLYLTGALARSLRLTKRTDTKEILEFDEVYDSKSSFKLDYDNTERRVREYLEKPSKDSSLYQLLQSHFGDWEKAYNQIVENIVKIRNKAE